MGLYLTVKGYSDKNDKEYKKHFEAVHFCAERNLSLPKETVKYFGEFKGEKSIDVFDLKSILHELDNGKEIDLPIEENLEGGYTLKVSDIPKDVSIIKITME